MSGELPFTGERFVPGAHGEIWVEHWHRYHFASRWVAGKRVLDVACGEGYGSALLARTAGSVIGADISAEAIQHAKGAYAGVKNLSFVEAPCTRLPIPDGSIDVAVSFETIEHIDTHEEFLRELARVLAPDGILLMSCPNKLEYSDKRAFKNEFHVKELYRDDLARAVGRHFPEIDWYGQRPTFFSLIAPEKEGGAQAQLVEVRESKPEEALPRLESPLYFVVAASRRRDALDAIAPALSVLADRDDWVHRDYDKMTRDLAAHLERRNLLEDHVAERDTTIANMTSDIQEYQRQRSVAAQTIAEKDRSIALHDQRIAELESALAAETRMHQDTAAAKQAEIDRRAGWRWWLKLPLIRLGILK